MRETTEADYRKVSEWLDNAKWHGDVVRAIGRLADSTPGVEEWAVLLALLWVWDGLAAKQKVDALCDVAAPRGGLVDGLLTDDADDGPAEPEPAKAFDATTADVVVGTRVSELRDEGGRVHNATVLQVLPECVIVERDGPLAATEPSRVALRWNEFAVHPEPPVGAVGFPPGKEATNA